MMDKRPGDLLSYWEKTASGQLSENTYSLRLSVEDAAKLEALAELYPKRSIEQLMGDLLAAALYEVEESMPYIKGVNVVEKDEFGDEVYEDAGLTPKFQELAQKKLRSMKST